jgi:hypothetical protein
MSTQKKSRSRENKNKRAVMGLKSQIERAQRRVRQYTKAGRSLADELIAERREAAKRE